MHFPFVAVHVFLPWIALVVVPIISMRERTRQHRSQTACICQVTFECPTADAMAVTLCPKSYTVVMHWLNFEHTTTLS